MAATAADTPKEVVDQQAQPKQQTASGSKSQEVALLGNKERRGTNTTTATKASLQLLKETLPPGTKQRLSWTAGYSFEGTALSAPILAVNGRRQGPILCLTAAIHGDELNGIAMVHRIIDELKPDQLSGAVIGAPIVNLYGYRRSSRYLPDRRDLNRYFPGNPNGNLASRIAHSFFHQVITHCDALVDLHTGSFHRTNLPQIRADLRNPDVLKLARGFTGVAVVHNEGTQGTLRRAATDAGIPTITLEAGGPKRLQLRVVEQSLKGIKGLMNRLAMLNGTKEQSGPGTLFYQTKWIRTDRAGILLSEVQLGDPVKTGQQLGVVTDPITNQEVAIVSPYEGRLLGMALNQVTIPGYAAYHIGISTGEPTPAEEVSDHVASKAKSPDPLEKEAFGATNGHLQNSMLDFIHYRILEGEAQPAPSVQTNYLFLDTSN